MAKNVLKCEFEPALTIPPRATAQLVVNDLACRVTIVNHEGKVLSNATYLRARRGSNVFRFLQNEGVDQ